MQQKKIIKKIKSLYEKNKPFLHYPLNPGRLGRIITITIILHI